MVDRTSLLATGRSLKTAIVLLAILAIIAQARQSRSQFATFDQGQIANLPKVRIMPAARVGYQQMSLSFTYSHQSIPWAWWFHRGSVDLSLRDAGVWLIGGDAVFEVTPSVSLFCKGDISFRRDAQLALSEAPYDFFFTSRGVTPLHSESAKRFQWWQLDVGAAYEFWNGVSVIGGVKLDRTTFSIVGADLENLFFSGPENHGGDFLTKLWIPYLGAHMQTPLFRSYVLYSPVMWADVRFALTEGDDKGTPSSEEARFAFKKNGSFLEGFLESAVTSYAGAQVSLWGKATYLKVRGHATQTWTVFDTSTGGAIPGFPANVADEDTAELKRCTWAVGIVARSQF